MKKVCDCCKKRVATIEDEIPQYAVYIETRVKPTFDVCRKCYDASEKSGLVKSEFYEHALSLGFIAS